MAYALRAAYGLAAADVVKEAQTPCASLYTPQTHAELWKRVLELAEDVRSKLESEGFDGEHTRRA